MRELPLRWIALGLAMLLIALQVTLWAGHGGLPTARKIKAQVEAQTADNAQLRKRNEALQAEVADLKQGTEAIEEQARDQLGMVKAGETFYQVIDDKSTSNATANAVEGVQIVDTPIDESRPGTTTDAPSAAPKQ